MSDWKCTMTEEPDISNLPDKVEVCYAQRFIYRGTLWVDYLYCQVLQEERPSIQFESDEGGDAPKISMSLLGFDKRRVVE